MEQYRKVFPIEDVHNCLICNFDNPIFKFYGSDDRFGYPGEFPVVECPKCGLGYLAKRIKEEYIGELYDHYYRTRSKIGISNVPGFWRSYLKKIPFLLFLYNNIFRSSYNLYDYLKFKKNIRVLDVGSGFIPDKAKEIIKQHGHWLAVEVDSEISRSLRKQGLPVYCGTLEEYLETKPQSFDYIILSQIIEHIYNPKKFLRIVRSLLSRGGKVILSCPNYDSFLKEKYGQQWLHWHVPYHVTHFNRFTLERLANSAQLKIKNIYTSTPFPWYSAQTQIGKGLAYNANWFGKFPIEKPLIDIRLIAKHRSHKGDILVGKLEAI